MLPIGPVKAKFCDSDWVNAFNGHAAGRALEPYRLLIGHFCHAPLDGKFNVAVSNWVTNPTSFAEPKNDLTPADRFHAGEAIRVGVGIGIYNGC